MTKLVSWMSNERVTFPTYLLLTQQFFISIYLTLLSTNMARRVSFEFFGIEKFLMTGTAWWSGGLLAASALCMLGLVTRTTGEIKLGGLLGFIMWAHATGSFFLQGMIFLPVICMFYIVFFAYLYIRAFFLQRLNQPIFIY